MKSALDLVLAEPWAITETYLRAIVGIVSGETNSDLERLQALQAKSGKPLQNTRAVTMRDGVAVIPVVGPMFRRANLMTELSGATSYEMLAQDFNRAVDDGSTRAIILDWSSPGGAVSGVNELAGMIYAARGRKPIASYIGSTAASAAYWLATAADPGRVIMDATALVGSIGVMATFLDTRARDEARGVKEVRFISSGAPNKNRDPLTDPEGLAALMAQIDAIEDVFVASVARHRGVSVEKVRSDFGQGGELVGASAIAAGMADGLGSLEGLIASLKEGEVFPGHRPAGRAPAANATEKEKIMANENTITTEAALRAAYPDMVSGIEKSAAATALAAVSTVDHLKASFPALVSTVEASAKEAAVQDERKRLIAIDEATVPGCEDVAKDAKEAGLSAGEFALKQAAAMKQQGAKALADIQGSAAAPVKPEKPAAGKGNVTAEAVSARATALVEAAAKEGKTLSYANAAVQAKKEMEAAA